jgi:hypothetical protein
MGVWGQGGNDRNGGATAAQPSVRRLALIGVGWTIVGLGIVLSPLPGPGGLPVILIGAIIVLRNSWDARRFFVRMKRRYPVTLMPLRKGLDALRGRLRRRR